MDLEKVRSEYRMLAAKLDSRRQVRRDMDAAASKMIDAAVNTIMARIEGVHRPLETRDLLREIIAELN